MHTEDGLVGGFAQDDGWDRQRWGRVEAAFKCAAFEASAGTGGERQRAAEQGVPRATLRHWLAVKQEDNGNAVVDAFFRSPEGAAVLHGIVMAAALTITMLLPGGIRTLQAFLRLGGLSRYVASSYGALHALTKRLELELFAFEDHERPRLGLKMARKLAMIIV